MQYAERRNESSEQLPRRGNIIVENKLDKDMRDRQDKNRINEITQKLL